MPTPKAYIFIALSLLLFLIGANLQSGWIYLLSFFILADVGYSFLASKKMFKKSSIERRVPLRGEANRAFKISYSYSGMPDGFFIIEKQLDKKFLAYGSKRTAEFEINLKRGIYDLNELILETYLPNGFLKIVRTFRLAGKIIIWPESDIEKIGFANELVSATGLFSGVQKKSGEEYSGIREYQTGDALKKIHWKKTALYRTILVRDEVEAFQRKASVFVDNSNGVSSDEFEDLMVASRTIIEILFSYGYEPTVYFYEGGSLKKIQGNYYEINDALAGLKPENPSFGPIFEENYPQELYVAVTANPDACRAVEQQNLVVVVVGEKELPANRARCIRVKRKDGKRTWSYL